MGFYSNATTDSHRLVSAQQINTILSTGVYVSEFLDIKLRLHVMWSTVPGWARDIQIMLSTCWNVYTTNSTVARTEMTEIQTAKSEMHSTGIGRSFVCSEMARCSLWSDEEVKKLIAVWGEEEIQSQLDGTTRNTFSLPNAFSLPS